MVDRIVRPPSAGRAGAEGTGDREVLADAVDVIGLQRRELGGETELLGPPRRDGDGVLERAHAFTSGGGT